jgi:PGF-CTERM protein
MRIDRNGFRALWLVAILVVAAAGPVAAPVAADSHEAEPEPADVVHVSEDGSPDEPEETEAPGQPGFGLVVTLVAFLLITTLAVRARARN